MDLGARRGTIENTAGGCWRQRLLTSPSWFRAPPGSITGPFWAAWQAPTPQSKPISWEEEGPLPTVRNLLARMSLEVAGELRNGPRGHSRDINSIYYRSILVICDFLGGSDSKASACNAGDPGSILGSGRSPGGGNGNPLQYSCLGNPMDGGAW